MLNELKSWFEALTHEDKLGIKLFGVVLVSILFLGVIAIIVTTEEAVDSEFCLEETPVPHTVILMDRTDPLTLQQQSYFVEVANSLMKDFALHEKVSVFFVDSEMAAKPQPTFSMCNPGNGENLSGYLSNPKKVKKLFKSKFESPFTKTISVMSSEKSFVYSPIMEMIKSVSYRYDFRHTDKKRKLIILSDMIQNTDGYSQYNDSALYKNFKKSAYARENEALLGGVEVTIYYLWRTGLNNVQGRKHISFWEHYFANMGAKLVAVERIN